MKKIILAAFAMVFSVGTMTAQADTSILPQNSRDLLEESFGDLTIAEVEKEDGWLNWDKNEMYEVHFTNGIKLDFNEKGELTEVDSNNGETIPEEIIPEEIRSYLEENEEGVEIISWEMDDNGQEVGLADGRELEFDDNGEFLKED